LFQQLNNSIYFPLSDVTTTIGVQVRSYCFHLIVSSNRFQVKTCRQTCGNNSICIGDVNFFSGAIFQCACQSGFVNLNSNNMKPANCVDACTVDPCAICSCSFAAIDCSNRYLTEIPCVFANASRSSINPGVLLGGFFSHGISRFSNPAFVTSLFVDNLKTYQNISNNGFYFRNFGINYISDIPSFLFQTFFRLTDLFVP